MAETRRRRKRITPELRAEIFERGEYTCEYCGFSSSPGRAADELDIDHKNPVARGGSDSRRNLTTAWNRCNGQKGKRSKAEYLRWRKRNADRSSIRPHQRGKRNALRSAEQASRVDLWSALKKFWG